jgi:transposase-like protein
VCGYCGSVENSTSIEGRDGYYQCNSKGCRKQFTVRVGTVFERSHIGLNKWLMAAFLLSASKKGISAHQMSRMLGVSYKSTWFMMHRLREAMKDYGASGPIGGEGKTIEADETYIGRKRGTPKGTIGFMHKFAVVALVERGGTCRAFHIERANAANVRDVLVRHADRKSKLMTDEATYYPKVGEEYASHDTVNHKAKEYVRGDAHTNTVEGFFSIFKRGMRGVYQHCGEDHLHRYVTEFEFRYSNRSALGVSDKQRAEKLLAGVVGKRLTYRRTDIGANE